MLQMDLLTSLISLLTAASLFYVTGGNAPAYDARRVIDNFYSRFNSTGETDIVFILDRSSSITWTGWISLMNFVKNILDPFIIDKDHARVAIVTFSSTATVDLDNLEPGLTTNQETKCSVYQRIRQMKDDIRPSGHAATYRALEEAFHLMLNTRTNTKKAVFILTDSLSNIGPPPMKMATEIQSLSWNQRWDKDGLGPQVEIYAFGIGAASTEELRSMTSDLPYHFYHFPDFTRFDQFIRTLNKDNIEDAWIDVADAHCSGQCHSNSKCMCGTKVGQYSCACQPGYELNGKICRACQKGYYKNRFLPEPCLPCPKNSTTSNTGSVQISDCHPIPGHRKCSELPDVLHASKFYVSGDLLVEVANTGIECADVRDGNSCHYECEAGFRLSGSPVMKCNASGHWEGEVPSCSIVDCYNVPESWTARVGVVLNYVTGNTTYGSVINATCTPGLVPFGHITWTCSKSGLWTRPWNFECREVYCNTLLPLTHLMVIPSECAIDRQRLGFNCQMFCEDGFQQTGPTNYTCEYEARTLWTPHGDQTRCTDIQAPVIKCPSDVEIFVRGWQDNCTFYDYENPGPQVYDNSDNTTYVISGAPHDKMFCIGLHLLRYTATDATGNTALCERNILVKAKTIEIVQCPENITVQVNSSNRTRDVTWPDPVFLGPDGTQLEFNCNPQQGPKTFGIHKVTCFPTSNPTAKCEFHINVEDPPCHLPLSIRTPVNGDIVCRNQVQVAKECSIVCHERYEWISSVNNKFVCHWNGSWNLQENAWLECYRSRRPRRAILENQLLARFNGSCTSENKAKMIETFIHTVVDRILTDTQGPCQAQHDCRIKEVKVNNCSGRKIVKRDMTDFRSYLTFFFKNRLRRMKRSPEENDTISDLTTILPTMPFIEDDRTNVTLFFVLEASLKLVNGSAVRAVDQKNLIRTLDEVYLILSESIRSNDFQWRMNDMIVTAVDLESNDSQLIGLNCSRVEITEIQTVESNTAACFTCPVGTYYQNGSCILCPFGFYKDQEGKDDCERCSSNQNTTFEGAKNVSECLDPCQVGYYSATGYEPCVTCSQGTYEIQNKSKGCGVCPENQYTLNVASFSLEDCIDVCPPNAYSVTGLVPCTACSFGSHQPKSHSTDCILCSSSVNSSYCPTSVSCTDYNMTCGTRGSCILNDTATIPLCLCDSGFSGSHCETNIDDCIDNQCQHNGTCIDRVSNYYCSCSSSFTGHYCDYEVDECNFNSCLNGGSCVDGFNSYICVCSSGFSGTNCDVNIDECLSDPCANGGNCTDAVHGFTCSCSRGYTGDLCDKLIDFCVNVTCLNNGRCLNKPFGPTCSCLPGYTGQNCEDEFDACSSDPCFNNGTCIRDVDSFYCKCRLGFVGVTCLAEISPDFDLIFTTPSITNYVMLKLKLLSSWLHQVSICVWLRTDDVRNYGTIWSYSVESNWLTADDANVLTAYDYGRLRFYVNGNEAITNISLNDGMWHHLCLTWDGFTGDWNVYVNGSRKESGHDLAKGTYIHTNGYLVLGQEQDSVGGSFNMQESFLGEMTQFVIFSEMLLDAEVAHLSSMGTSGCQSHQGSILSWTEVIDNIKGNVILRNNSWCMDVNECLFPQLKSACGSNERCEDKRGSFVCMPCESTTEGGGSCSDRERSSNPCSPNPCSNGAICESDSSGFRCRCVPGFTGRLCSDTAVTLSCEPDPCQNDGRCDKSADPKCICTSAWTGRYCQVSFRPSCDLTPCLNNGTCISDSDHGYRCVCLNDTVSKFGSNCEILKSCSSSPCLYNGTCIDNSQTEYQCICGYGFTGHNCELALPSTTTAPVPCSVNVDCRNGGTCVIVGGKFECRCTRDYTGIYCGSLRDTETRVYNAIVKLEEEFNSRLLYNKTFKETFLHQIHQIYADITRNGKIYATINNIRRGSILVDFALTHTYYVDEVQPGVEAMKRTLEKELTKGKLGIYQATLENFEFYEKSDTKSANVQLTLIISIVLLVIILAVAIFLTIFCYIKRCGPQSKDRNKHTNQMRVSNPTYQPDFPTSVQQSRNIMVEESLYCEPREILPYSTSEDSDKESDPGASCQPNKRKKNWHLRQSIPLPPKPDEPQTNSLSTTCLKSGADLNRATPPPPYYPSHGPAPIPASRDRPLHQNAAAAPVRHNYENDSCYFTPLSDEEAGLINQTKSVESVSDNAAFDSESAYLIPRLTSESENVPSENIEMTHLNPQMEECVKEEDGAKTKKTESLDAAAAADSDDHVTNHLKEKIGESSEVMYAIRRSSTRGSHDQEDAKL